MSNEMQAEVKIWPYGTRKNVLVLMAARFALAVKDQSTGEGFLLLNHGLHSTKLPEKDSVGVITFEEGGPLGGRWRFTPTERRMGTARLTAFRTSDGFWNFRTDKATIGKTYQVDLNSIRMAHYENKPTGKQFSCEVIDAICDTQEIFAPLPTEILEIDNRQ